MVISAARHRGTMRYAPAIEIYRYPRMAWLRTFVRLLASLGAGDRLAVLSGAFLAVAGLAALLHGHARIPHTARFWGEADFQGVDAMVFGYFALIAAYGAIRHVLAGTVGRIDPRVDIAVAFGLLVFCAVLHRLTAA